MKQFIKDNRPYCQSDRDDLTNYYISLGCIEVPVLYRDELIIPIWNGKIFIESATQTDIDRINEEKIKEYNLNQFQELLPTDWYFTRFIETGVEVPEEIKNERNAIRIKYDLLKNK